ncbi:jg21397 [Pararge aegeria aegeria]|uniref:Jg21397 protein n=1 Tax=Pararge aegeria aegeria TaxID=348720 RepID=A0A8S4S0L8_9NEOP|nr:jg21397 [Pararge aegeria aegeria]
MIRLNSIIAVARFVVYGNCRVCGECLICLELMTLARGDALPLDWQRSQFHLDCQTSTGGCSKTEFRTDCGAFSAQSNAPWPRPSSPPPPFLQPNLRHILMK